MARLQVTLEAGHEGKSSIRRTTTSRSKRVWTGP